MPGPSFLPFSFRQASTWTLQLHVLAPAPGSVPATPTGIVGFDTTTVMVLNAFFSRFASPMQRRMKGMQGCYLIPFSSNNHELTCACRDNIHKKLTMIIPEKRRKMEMATSLKCSSQSLSGHLLPICMPRNRWHMHPQTHLLISCKRRGMMSSKP